MTEQDLAARLHRDLGGLAQDAGWSPTPTTGQDQGSYSDPIADALEAAGVADLASATAAELKKVRRLALGFCFDRLAIHYVTAVDHGEDGLSESLSQILANIERARAISLGQVAVGASLRGKPRLDWTPSDGDIAL